MTSDKAIAIARPATATRYIAIAPSRNGNAMSCIIDAIVQHSIAGDRNTIGA